MGQFVVNILWISVICGVLIIGLWALSPVLNKHFAAKWKYWAWMLITIRLIFPIGFGIPQFSAPAVMSDVTPFQNVPAVELAAPLHSPAQDGTLETLVYSAYSLAGGITLYQVLFIVWFIGGIVFATVQIVRYFATKRKILRWSVTSQRREIQEMLSNLSQEMGIDTAVYPMVNNEIAAPMIIGLIRPVLILPHEDYEISDLAFILRHELTHFKNKDIVFKIALFIANTVHWFNPIVYMMVQETHADVERVCDDEVTKNCSSEERRAYCEVILNAISQRKMRGGIISTNFHLGSKKIKARFMNIMDARKRKSGFVQLFMVAFVVIMMSFISPAAGYSTPRDTADAMQTSGTEPTASHTFTTMTFDAENIDVLEINLMYGDVFIQKNYEFAPGFHVLLSGTTLLNTLTINPATRTAHISNTAPSPYGFGYHEEQILFVVVSGEPDWAFERVNIHLENGNVWYAHTHIEEFLAKDLNISLPRGSVMNQITQEVGVLIPHE